MARRASFTITASPLGEEEVIPSGRGAKGVAVPPWKRREAGRVGNIPSAIPVYILFGIVRLCRYMVPAVNITIKIPS
jgi:hypothetical protein